MSLRQYPISLHRQARPGHGEMCALSFARIGWVTDTMSLALDPPR